MFDLVEKLPSEKFAIWLIAFSGLNDHMQIHLEKEKIYLHMNAKHEEKGRCLLNSIMTEYFDKALSFINDAKEKEKAIHCSGVYISHECRWEYNYDDELWYCYQAMIG